MADQLKNAIDNLGWTGINDDEAWKDAAWEVFKAMRDEIDRLSRAVGDTATTDCPECDGVGVVGPPSLSVTAIDDHQICPMCNGSGNRPMQEANHD